ncbi:hypothetical protein Tco_1276291 [Tanacetum coccineum]
MDKHGHGNGRAHKKLGECYQSQEWSTSVNLVNQSQGQFKKRSTHGQSITSPSTPIGQYPTKDATWIVKEAQGMKLFTLESLSEEAQTYHNHGLPRWQSVCSKSNPTDEI